MCTAECNILDDNKLIKSVIFIISFPLRSPALGSFVFENSVYYFSWWMFDISRLSSSTTVD